MSSEQPQPRVEPKPPICNRWKFPPNSDTPSTHDAAIATPNSQILLLSSPAFRVSIRTFFLLCDQTFRVSSFDQCLPVIKKTPGYLSVIITYQPVADF
jgi:hypothetical protein